MPGKKKGECKYFHEETGGCDFDMVPERRFYRLNGQVEEVRPLARSRTGQCGLDSSTSNIREECGKHARRSLKMLRKLETHIDS